MHEKKTVITKKTIAKDLLIENSKSLKFYLIATFAWSLFIGLLFLVFYSLVLQNRDVNALGFVIYFACMLFCLFPSFFFIMSAVASLSERKRLNNCDFLVLADEVSYKEEKSVRRRGNTYIENTIHLYKYGDVHVRNTTWYQLTSAHDMYYIVVYSRDSKIPKKYYPAKIYEYQESE